MIFFDIDGTLIDHASASAAASLAFFDYFAGKIPFAREDFSTIWEAILTKHFDRFCRGEISLWEQRRARIREVFNHPKLTDEDCDSRYRIFIQEYESRTLAFADAAPCLARLQDQRLGIISNGAREQQIGKLERAGLLKYFSVLVFSEDVNLGKPSPKIFLEACRLADQEPVTCLHVGDDVKADIEAGLAVGMKPVWLNRGAPAPCELPVPQIVNLHQLESVLGCYAPPYFADPSTTVVQN